MTSGFPEETDAWLPIPALTFHTRINQLNLEEAKRNIYCYPCKFQEENLEGSFHYFEGG